MPSKSPSSRDKLAIARANAIGRLLLLARKGFVRRVEQEMRKMGHAPIPAAFLAITPYIDAGGTRNTELAQRVGVSRQAVGKLVMEFENSGILVREPDESDGRAWRVRLTDDGLQMLARAHRVVARVEKHYETLIGPDNFAQVRRALRIIADSGS